MKRYWWHRWKKWAVREQRREQAARERQDVEELIRTHAPMLAKERGYTPPRWIE